MIFITLMLLQQTQMWLPRKKRKNLLLFNSKSSNQYDLWHVCCLQEWDGGEWRWWGTAWRLHRGQWESSTFHLVALVLERFGLDVYVSDSHSPPHSINALLSSDSLLHSIGSVCFQWYTFTFHRFGLVLEKFGLVWTSPSRSVTWFSSSLHL